MVYNIAVFLLRILMHIVFRIRATGKENIPANSSCIICSNHISLIDPVSIAIFSKRKVHFIAKKEIFKNKFLSKLFYALGAFPVDRQSGKDIGAYKNAISYLKKNEVLGIFFQGTRLKDVDSSDAKLGVSMFALMGKSVIVPTGIVGTYKPFHKVEVRFGKPIYLDEHFGKKITHDLLEELTEKITHEVSSLTK